MSKDQELLLNMLIVLGDCTEEDILKHLQAMANFFVVPTWSHHHLKSLLNTLELAGYLSQNQ